MHNMPAGCLTARNILISIWSVLFVCGFVQYSGSWVVYVIFSAVFLVVLVSGFCSQISYGYLFLVVMLWLGFWLKLIVHSLADYPFGEPVGYFLDTPAEWDDVLLISSLGGLGILCSRIIYALAKLPTSMCVKKNAFNAPEWYQSVRVGVWILFMIFCIALAVINALFGIVQSGMVSRTVFFWPLNAIIGWLVVYGLSLGVATLVWWDVSLGKKISLVVYSILLEGFASTVTALSRGGYVFHVIPQVIGLYKNKKFLIGWSRGTAVGFVVVFAVLFVISNSFVNTLRLYYYAEEIPSSIVFFREMNGNEMHKEVQALARFAVDRWLGLEGVMAASAYPKKDGDLFFSVLIERGALGKSTIYQEICQSHYRFMDMWKFQFASLPGAVGFLFFSGHYWAVTIGMFVLGLFVIGSEAFVCKCTGNPLLCALWGGAVANGVAQMGIAPRGLLLFFFEMSCGVAVVSIIQSRFFSKAMQALCARISLAKRWG